LGGGSRLSTGRRKEPVVNDGWDTWPIEEKDEKDSFEENDFVPETRHDVNSASSIGWSANANSHGNKDEFFNSLGSNSNKVSPLKNHSNSKSLVDWGTEDWNESPAEVPADSTGRQEEMRKRREERKLLRQHELETKKSVKPGPMKLGARKI